MSKIIIMVDADICCPHCDAENSVCDISTTKSIENTCVSWRPSDGINQIECEECGRIFWIRSHLEIVLSKSDPTDSN